ncbi:Integral membrane protein [Colletotrichum scovillei]|nr:Integral membrane protein [Colletotrichum scovillei]
MLRMFNGASSATTAQLTMDDGTDNEMQTRLSLITKIRKELDFKRRTGFFGIYRAGFWSLLMVLDISLLQDLLHKLQTLRPLPMKEKREYIRHLEHLTYAFPRFIRLCNQWVPDDRSSTMTTEAHSQFEIEQTKARGRDRGLCIATGVADPEICYIVAPIICPPESLLLLVTIVQSAEVIGWDEDFCSRIKTKLSARHKGITTLMTNMLCLSRQLEPSWSEGLFALEPLESLDDDSSLAIIRLRVHWLKRTRIASMASRIAKSFSTDPRDVFLEEEWSQVNSRPIKDGSVIEISAESQDQLPDRDLLRLRWLLMRLHALSGAPDPRIYPHGHGEIGDMMAVGGIYDDDHSEYYEEEDSM